MKAWLRKVGLGPRLSLVAVVALLPALATILYNETEFRQERAGEVRESALRTAELVSLEMAQIINGGQGILEAMAAAPVVRGLRDQECMAYLADVIADLPQFNAIGVMDIEGNLRCRSRPASVVTGFGERPYFQEVLRGGRFVLGEYTISPNDQTAILPLAVPVRGPDRAVIGVLVAGLSLEWLGERIRARQFAPDSSLTIADRTGTILAREPLSERFVGTRIPDSFRHLVNADAPGTLELTSQDGTQRVQGYYPTTSPPLGIYISAGLSRTEAFRTINEATQRNLLIAALSAFLALTLALLFARQLVLLPVQRLQSTIDQWRSGQISARTGMRAGRDEISDVGASIDQFLEALKQASTAQNQADRERDLLTSEMQHRVKNILSNVLAIASQTFAGSGNEEKLSSFSQRLIAMGRAQTILADRNWSQADIGKIVREGTALFDQPERFEITGPALFIGSRAAMALSMALHELCTNAIKYGALSVPEGTVRIGWQVSEHATPVFSLHWQEIGGPPVQVPSRTGFGTMMIEKVFALEIDGKVELRYELGGVVWIVTAPLTSIAGDLATDQ